MPLSSGGANVGLNSIRVPGCGREPKFWAYEGTTLVAKNAASVTVATHRFIIVLYISFRFDSTQALKEIYIINISMTRGVYAERNRQYHHNERIWNGNPANKKSETEESRLKMSFGGAILDFWLDVFGGNVERIE